MIRKALLGLLSLAGAASVGLGCLTYSSGYIQLISWTKRDPVSFDRFCWFEVHCYGNRMGISYAYWLDLEGEGLWKNFELHGFRVTVDDGEGGPKSHIRILDVDVPRWFLFGVSGLFLSCPTLAFIRGPLRRYRRRRKGLCLKCGYNLTGNTSGRCPECGRPT